MENVYVVLIFYLNPKILVQWIMLMLSRDLKNLHQVAIRHRPRTSGITEDLHRAPSRENDVQGHRQEEDRHVKDQRPEQAWRSSKEGSGGGFEESRERDTYDHE